MKLIIVLHFFLSFAINSKRNTQMMVTRTPDGMFLNIILVSKQEADSIQTKFASCEIDSELLNGSSKHAFLLSNGRVLYRQFFKDVGFVFPTVNEYKLVLKGDTYWNVSIQVDNQQNFFFSYWLNPASVSKFKKNSVRELVEYETYDNNKFYLLSDGSVISARYRTNTLSDGHWYNSLKDFDYFYPILSGKGP